MSNILFCLIEQPHVSEEESGCSSNATGEGKQSKDEGIHSKLMLNNVTLPNDGFYT